MIAESAYIAWLVMQKSVEEVLDDACKLMPSALHSEVWHLRRSGIEVSPFQGVGNRGAPLYTEVSPFQGVGIEGSHCIQRCLHFRGLE